MKVLVDTSVWSLALRKKTLPPQEIAIVEELKELIHELRVVMIGPIRQELLSEISDETRYMILKDKLRPFEDLALHIEEYEKVAEIFNVCRRNGIQGSHIDFLICAASMNESISIFTTDRDFMQYKNHIKIPLHTVRDELRV